MIESAAEPPQVCMHSPPEKGQQNKMIPAPSTVQRKKGATDRSNSTLETHITNSRKSEIKK